MATYVDLVALGLTRRQVYHWTDRGYLAASPGPRRVRVYPAAEVQVADRMRRMTAVGVTPEAAHRAARSDGWLSADVRVVLVEPSGVTA